MFVFLTHCYEVILLEVVIRGCFDELFVPVRALLTVLFELHTVVPVHLDQNVRSILFESITKGNGFLILWLNVLSIYSSFWLGLGLGLGLGIFLYAICFLVLLKVLFIGENDLFIDTWVILHDEFLPEDYVEMLIQLNIELTTLVLHWEAFELNFVKSVALAVKGKVPVPKHSKDVSLVGECGEATTAVEVVNQVLLFCVRHVVNSLFVKEIVHVTRVLVEEHLNE
jgi:hypothetical protein